MGVQVTEVQKSLGGMSYPASKGEIVSHAEGHGARDEVLDRLRGIPDRTYDGPNGIMKELSGELGGPTS